MGIEAALVAAAAFLLSYVLTGVLRARSMSGRLLDVPNERSSHRVPTPRGGGVAIVICLTAALVAFTLSGTIKPSLLAALGGGGLCVAVVGFLDDRYRLSAPLRLAVHVLAALWALLWLDGLPPLQFGRNVLDLGVWGYAVGALGIVWTLNLFNFMDGIDGIAASEAVFVAWAGAALALAAGIGGEVGPVSLVLGAACCGFLLWNWPPAKIFMGDVGSGYLGFVIAVIAIVACRDAPGSLHVWLILGGLFFVDATVTFLRRLTRREKVLAAHRSHAYQWLSRRWQSHRNVTLLVLALNLCWLLPAAWVAMSFPRLAGWMALVALLPLAAAALLVGAGRSEKTAAG